MTSDCDPSFWDDAFALVEPRDEAHRAKLEALKERMKAIEDESKREIESIRTQSKSFDEPAIAPEVLELRRESAALSKQWKDAIKVGSEEQAILLAQIHARIGR